MRRTFDLALAAAAGFGAFMALILSVYLSGATFGQRCGRAYSGPAEQERCVKRLSTGGDVYPASLSAEGV
jgi:hypothetical protein